MPKLRLRRRGLVLAIDPGLGGTGVAMFNSGKLEDIHVIRGTISTDQPLADRCGGIADLIHRWVPYFSMDHVILEMPQMMTNIKGIAAQGGAIYKLTFLVGYLARAMEPARVTVVTPMEWKGQLPKDVVQRRVERKLGLATCRRLNIRSHAWDAVGLGLWFLKGDAW